MWFIKEVDTKEKHPKEACPKVTLQLRNEDTDESNGDLKEYQIKGHVELREN